MGVRLDALRTMVLERADMVSSSFVTTAELNRYINQSAAELHGVLVVRFEDYFTSPTPSQFSLTGSQSTHQLSASFMKLRGLDYYTGGDWVPLRAFSWEERHRWSDSNTLRGNWHGETERRYRIMGRHLTFVPEGQVSGTYRYWHVPRWTDLSSDSDELDDAMTGWHEYIVVDAAAKCMEKEESDPSALLMHKQSLLKRIEGEASNRDASEQEFIADVSRTWEDDWL